MKRLGYTIILFLVLTGCSGVELKPEPLNQVESTRFEDGYQNWKRLNSEPVIRRGQSEAWYSFISPTARAENNSFVPDSVLVKEVRKVQFQGEKPQIGDLKFLSLMIKSNEGWTYMAIDPVSGQPYTGVDTDGCLWCHEDRKHTDYTFRALESL